MMPTMVLRKSMPTMLLLQMMVVLHQVRVPQTVPLRMMALLLLRQ